LGVHSWEYPQKICNFLLGIGLKKHLKMMYKKFQVKKILFFGALGKVAPLV